MIRRLTVIAVVATLSGPAVAQDRAAWSRPTAPFRITDNIYYVRSEGLAAYLIVGRSGAVLLDGTLQENVPAIERNIQSLGFRLSDVRLLINSHAHFDHAAGLAQLKRDTGAALVASAADRAALESGAPPSVVSYGLVRFPPVKVDRVLVSGRPVRLGNLAMTPTVTPGHTPGCTTWSTTTTSGGRPYRVVFPCSVTVAGNKLVGNSGYPGIVGDFRRTFPMLRRMQADIVLPGHPESADLFARRDRRDAGEADAFVDPGLLRRMTDEGERAFEADLAEQQRGARGR